MDSKSQPETTNTGNSKSDDKPVTEKFLDNTSSEVLDSSKPAESQKP